MDIATKKQTVKDVVAECESILERVEAMRRELRSLHDRIVILMGKIEKGGQ